MTTSPSSGTRYRRTAGSLLLIALLAGGCRGGEEGKARAESPAAAPRPGGTVVIGWNADLASVNELIVPAANPTDDLLFKLFLRMFEEQPDFTHHPPTMAPQLAQSWEWSPDHKAITFHLQRNAVWSDGVPVTAEDVRWTWQAQTNPEVGWDSIAAKQYIDDVEVVDPATVRFHFKRAYAKQLLDINEGVILPKHAWEKLPFSQWRQGGDWFRAHLVTSGPFRLESWKPQQEIVLRKNDRYFEPGLPYLDRVVLRIIPDQASQLTQLLNGEIDFTPSLQPADAPQVAADPDLEVLSFWFRTYVGVAWNCTKPLFADPEVRRALTLATDRKRIVDAIYGDYGRVADSPILSFVWAHDASLRPWPYDPAAARAILAKKGWRDSDGDGVLDKEGKPFAFELMTNNGNQQRADAGVMIQDQLKKVGIRVELRLVEFNTLATRVQEGTYDAIVGGWGMDTSLDLTTQLHSRSIDEGNNIVRYKNPEVDRLIEQSMDQLDIADAKPYLDRIQQIVHRDQPFTFLWELKRLHGVNRRVHDAEPNLLFSLFNLRHWWVEPRS